MHRQAVTQPLKRSDLRRKLGKEWFILKRKFTWHLGAVKFAQCDSRVNLSHVCIQHRSMLLRPLKDVDMHLQHNKITNLRIAAKCIDKMVIQPGEVFSFWRMVGRPTRSKGYLEGLVLHNGQITKGIGGGLCQFGNLLYWMALHTPLSIKERWRHSFDVFPDVNRTIPFACGATLSYNYIDLQIENTTKNTFQIFVWLDEDYLHGEIRSNVDLKQRFEVFETDHRFQKQWWGGYTRHNSIWKRITDLSSENIEEILVTENSAIMMYTPFLNSASV